MKGSWKISMALCVIALAYAGVVTGQDPAAFDDEEFRAWKERESAQWRAFQQQSILPEQRSPTQAPSLQEVSGNADDEEPTSEGEVFLLAAAPPAGKTVRLDVPYYNQYFGSCWAATATSFLKAYGESRLPHIILRQLLPCVSMKNEGDGPYGLDVKHGGWPKFVSYMQNVLGPGCPVQFMFSGTNSYGVMQSSLLPILQTLTNQLDQGRPVLAHMLKHAYVFTGYEMTPTNNAWGGNFVFYMHDPRGMVPQDGSEGGPYSVRSWEWILKKAREKAGWNPFGYWAALFWVEAPMPKNVPLVSTHLPSWSAVQSRNNKMIGFAVDTNRLFSDWKYVVRWDPQTNAGYHWQLYRANNNRDGWPEPVEVIPAEANHLVISLPVWNADRTAAHDVTVKRLLAVSNGKPDLFEDRLVVSNGTSQIDNGPTIWSEIIPIVQFRLPDKEQVLNIEITLLDDHKSVIDTFDVQAVLAPLPHIDSIAPATGKAGDWVTISGTGFGTNQFGQGRSKSGQSRVLFGGKAAVDSQWTDTSIRVRIPVGAMPGPVVVDRNGSRSNPAEFDLASTAGTDLGAVFPVVLPAPAVGEGTLRLLLMAPERRLLFGDLPVIREHEPTALMAADFGLDHKYRADIEVLDQSVQNGQLVVQAQLLNLVATNLLGANVLLAVRIPDKPATSEEASTYEDNKFQQLFDQMTPAQAQAWLDEKKEFEKQQAARSLTKQQRQDQLDEWTVRQYKTLGLKVGALDVEGLYSPTRMVVYPVALQVSLPTGWSQSVPGQDRRNAMAFMDLGREFEYQHAVSNGNYTVKGQRASLSLSFGHNPNVESSFTDTYKSGWKGTSRSIQIGDYSGTVYERTTTRSSTNGVNPASEGPQPEVTRTVDTWGEGLLTNGHVYLKFRFNAGASGQRIVHFVDHQYSDRGVWQSSRREVVADHTAEADKQLPKIMQQVEGLLQSVRLVRRKDAEP